VDTGCVILLLAVAMGISFYIARRPRYTTSKTADRSRPPNWVVIEASGERWTTYAPTVPNVRQERGERTYIYSLDEVHTTNISGDKCSAKVHWKYSGEKVVTTGFAKIVEDSDGNIVYWGDTPAGIDGALWKIGQTFYKDSWDGTTHFYFFTEEGIRNKVASLPIEIKSIEYRDLRKEHQI
jgi:hypothetical protein